MQKQKKLLIMPAGLVHMHCIRQAVEMGYYVITCDNQPDNPGHALAHEHYIVSTVDRERVLELARRLKIDGVVNYASDVSAPTAAYVCETLGLPTSPLKSVEILTKKHLFRQFLRENGFNCPVAQVYDTAAEALADKDRFRLPVMVKPVDSAGTKGVNKLTDWSQLPALVEDAMHFSIDKRFIIEEYIEKVGGQISGDAFSVDGKLVFCSFGCEYYSDQMLKDFCPIGEYWPSTIDKRYMDLLAEDLQRLFTLLRMRTNEYNVEAIVGTDGKLYILECAARAGGSLIPQMIDYITGVNTVPWIIQAAAGDPLDLSVLDQLDNPINPASRKYIANCMLHANESGRYVRTTYAPGFAEEHLLYMESSVKHGDEVHQFRDAGDGFGEYIAQFDSQEQMLDMIPRLDEFVIVEVE